MHAKSSYHKNQSNTKISQLPSIDSSSFYFELLVIKICTLLHATGRGGKRLFHRTTNIFHRWEGIKRTLPSSTFSSPSWGKKKGTPKGSLVTPLLGLLILQSLHVMVHSFYRSGNDKALELPFFNSHTK